MQFLILFDWHKLHLTPACHLSASSVLAKGQVMTNYYRIMTRSGGFVWVQTCATTLLNGKNAEDQNVLAINYILRWVVTPGIGNIVM